MKIVGRVNGALSTIEWTPITYFFAPCRLEEVLAYYAVADVAWVTPL